MPQTMRVPQFPIRLIFDDGDSRSVASAEALLESVQSIDSTDPRSGVWIRDALDRTVRLRMRSGDVELFDVI